VGISGWEKREAFDNERIDASEGNRDFAFAVDAEMAASFDNLEPKPDLSSAFFVVPDVDGKFPCCRGGKPPPEILRR